MSIRKVTLTTATQPCWELTELGQQAPASLPLRMSSLLRQVQRLSDDQVKARLDAKSVIQ
jgi:hypothetical protein